MPDRDDQAKSPEEFEADAKQAEERAADADKAVAQARMAGHHLGYHRGVDHSGADRINANVVARVLQRGYLGESDHAVLGRSVRRLAV